MDWYILSIRLPYLLHTTMYIFGLENNVETLFNTKVFVKFFVS